MTRKRDAKRPGSPAVAKSPDVIPKGYAEPLRQLKERIRTAQLRAAPAVSRDLVLLDWYIGKSIVERQKNEGWGNAVIDRWGDDLQKAFPGDEWILADQRLPYASLLPLLQEPPLAPGSWRPSCARTRSPRIDVAAHSEPAG